MGNATNITYGSYNFQQDAGPIPILTINKEFNRFDDGNILGTKFKLTLQGELNLLPSGTTGYTNINQMQQNMFSGFNEDCKEFKVTCGGDTLIQQYPRVNSISFNPSPDNWSQSSDFTIELEWDGDNFSGYYLSSASETWSMQLDAQSSFYDLALSGGVSDNNMHLFTLSHSVSAKGFISCPNGITGSAGWRGARSFVISQLGYTQEDLEGSGVFNLNASVFSGWNHSRVQRIGERDGTFSVDETWLVADTGFQNNAGNAIEDFTANVSYDLQNGLTTTTINGSIQGIEELSYGSNPGDYTVVQNKFDNASGFWDNIRPRLLNRASVMSNVTLNPIVSNYNVGYNPTRGIISYNYAYDTRPCNYITGALTESISINDTNPTDTFAEIAILGRPFGPVLQSLNTVTSSTRTVTINAIMGPQPGCSDILTAISNKPNVSGLLCILQNDISGVNTQLFKSADQENWDVKTGSYNRTVTWTYVNCGGTPPNTSFC